MVYETSGYFETAPIQSDAEAVRLETSSTVPANTSIDVIVRQDTDSDGTAENEETVSLSGGDEVHELTSFSDVAGSDYWLRVELSSTDDSVTPEFDSATTDQALSFAETTNVYATTAQVVANAGQIRRARSWANPMEMSVDTNPMFRDSATTYTQGAGVESGRSLILGAVDADGIVIPQDEGTGLDPGEADWMSAGHFGAMFGQQHNTDYVEEGLQITADWDNQTFSLASGLAYLEYPKDSVSVQGYDSDGEYNQQWPYQVSFTTAVPEVNDLTFRDNQVSDVWISVVNSEPNLVNVRIQDADSIETPDPPAMRIAQIDATTEEVKNMNRGREVFPQVSSDPNDVSPGEAWYRTDLDEFRASLGDGGPIVTFDTTEV